MKRNIWLDAPEKAYTQYFGTSEKPMIYEVGSRDGKDGYDLAYRIAAPYTTPRDLRVVLFECNPPHIVNIQRDHPDAILITDAISNEAGEAEFLQIHGNKDYMGSSSLDLGRVDYNWVKETSTIKVKTRTLASVIEELDHQDTQIDIMKIDIEGYTWEALEGLDKYLRNVRVFHLETEIPGHARNKTNLDIVMYMEARGYRLFAKEHEWGPTIQDQTWVRI